MTRAEIIETMARAKCDWEGYEPDEVYPATGKPFWLSYEPEATRDIAALESAGLAVVTAEPTDAICEAIVETAEIYDEWGVDKHVSNSDAVYEAAIKAAQGAHKP